MNIKDLELIFKKAKEVNAKYIGVQIYTRGNLRPEIIINHKESFDNKLEYYKKAYTDNLVLKSYDGISIKGIAFGNSFKEIEDALINYHDECSIKNDMVTLEEASQEVVKLIRNKYNPHTTVIIKNDGIKIVSDEMYIPLN